MKQLLIVAFFSAAILAACNSNETPNTANEQAEPASASNAAPETASVAPSAIKGVVASYLQLKNALVKDNAKEAGTAGDAMVTAFQQVDKSGFSAEQKKQFEEIEGDAKEHAEHIGKNSSNIKHQREHFETLSKDMYELVKAFGGGQTLYVAHCPMYNNNKGADWISEQKEIANPFFGKEMLTCGSVKEELK